MRRSACRPAGGLGLFWNHDSLQDASLRTRLQDAHERWTPGIQVEDVGSGGDPLADWPGPHLLKLAEFTDVQALRYQWQRMLSGPDYVQLLSTMSAYGVRPAEHRDGLFEEVLDIVGDELTLTMTTVLYLARRT